MPSTPEKKRVIVNVKNVTPEILDLFTTKYPYGYDDEHIVKFKNAQGETIRAVPFETKDTKYLVKVSTEMDAKIEAFMDDDDDEETSEEGDMEAPEEGDDD